MKTRTDRILELVSQIYDAALAPDRWTQTLTRYADLQGADASNVICRSPGNEQVDFDAAARIDPSDLEAYADYYVNRDVFVSAGAALRAGTIFISSQYVPNHILERTEFYNDFLLQQDVHYFLSPILRAAADGLWTAPVLRRKRRGDFDAEEIRLAEQLAPHFRRALQIQQLIAPAAAAAHAHADAWDRLRIGVVLFNAQGEVCFVNRSAGAMLRADDGLRITGRHLAPARPADTIRLTRLLATVLRPDAGDLPNAGGFAAIHRPSGREAFHLMVAPAPGAPELMSLVRPDITVKALAFISEPDCIAVATTEAMQTLFGLTPTEAAVCGELGRGRTVTEAAAQLRVKPRTVRRHLEHVFEKTGTHRQATLVRLLLSSVALVADATGSPGSDQFRSLNLQPKF